MPITQFSEGEERYDTESVQKIIAAASRLQDTHRETMTIAQIEQVGSELGIDPAFIKRAIAAETTPVQMVPKKKLGRRLSGKTRGWVPRTKFAQRVPPVYVLLLTLLMLPIVNGRGGGQFESWMLLILTLVVPPVLSGVAGFRERDNQRGAGAGVVMFLSLTLGFLFLQRIGGNKGPVDGSVYLGVLVILGLPNVLLGALGGEFSQWQIRRRDRLAEESSIEPSNTTIRKEENEPKWV